MGKQGLRGYIYRKRQQFTAIPSLLLLSLLLVAAILGQLVDGHQIWWLALFLGLYLFSLILTAWRSGRIQWHDAWRFRRQIKKKSLMAMKQHEMWSCSASLNKLVDESQHYFQQHGYRLQKYYRGNEALLSVMRGRANRLGFLLAHVGFVMVVVAGFIDSQLFHDLFRDGLTQSNKSQVALRQGSMELNDNSVVSQVQLDAAEAVQMYTLPFLVRLQTIELVGGVRGLQNEHRTHLLIDDPRRLVKRTLQLGINKPDSYLGYEFYQQQISDGGSTLYLRAWPLFHSRMSALRITATVGKQRQLQTSNGPILIQFQDFVVKNIGTVFDNGQQQQVYRNTGPRLNFKANLADGSEYEYLLYMLPIEQQGRYFYLSGIRKNEAEHTATEEKAESAYHYLHIPVDPDGDVQRFLRLHALMNDTQAVLDVVRQTVNRNSHDQGRQAMVDTLLQTIQAFNHGGYEAMRQQLSRYTTADKLPALLALTNKLMRNVFYQLYEQVLREERGSAQGISSSFDIRFFDDALAASASLGEYGLPFYIQLDDFKYRPAVTIQIQRKPGKYLFMAGGLAVLFGLAGMFLMRHRRLWLLITPQEGTQEVILAGMGNRQQADFAHEFKQIAAELEQRLRQC